MVNKSFPKCCRSFPLFHGTPRLAFPSSRCSKKGDLLLSKESLEKSCTVVSIKSVKSGYLKAGCSSRNIFLKGLEERDFAPYKVSRIPYPLSCNASLFVLSASSFLLEEAFRPKMRRP